MNRINVIQMYKKGYSLDYIVRLLYLEKTKTDIPNHKFNDNFIVTKKSCTIEEVKKLVESTILEYIFKGGSYEL